MVVEENIPALFRTIASRFRRPLLPALAAGHRARPVNHW